MFSGNASRPKLETNPLVQALASYHANQDAINSTAAGPKGTIRGTIVDVDDPEERGRVKVVFDDMNPKKPQIEGSNSYGKREGKQTISHWVDCKPAFKGKQPKRLIGLRVNINATDGQYQYAVLDDVLWDEGVLTEKTKQPNTGTMVRLPCYGSGEMPPCNEENAGLAIVELNGFDGMDWCTVCLKRSGGYKWVNLMDRLHIHDSQDPDSDGDAEYTVHDDTHATT